MLECRELLDLIYPTLRADFEVIATYEHVHEQPLECPIFVTGGTQDVIAGLEHLEAWKQHTSLMYRLTMF